MMNPPNPFFVFGVQSSTIEPQEPVLDVTPVTDVGLLQEFLPMLLLISVLLASGACLYYAHRMFRILHASPGRPRSFGFDMYQGSALAEVHQLKSGFAQLNTALASKMNTLAKRFQQVSGAVDEIRERMGSFDVMTTRLQKENDIFRDGFLASHQAHLLGRLIDVRDQVSRIEPEKRQQYIEGEIDALLDYVLVKAIPDTTFLGNVLDENTAGFCEVVQVKPTAIKSENGVISEVLSSAFVIQVGTEDERVVKRAKVAAFRLSESPLVQPEQTECRGEDAALCPAASALESTPDANEEAGA
jgi:hypothetical protein